jgi:hypothetical protein
MSALFRVHWMITPQTAPQPHINCNRCGGLTPYRCSGKFRVNANGKRIDAWLIYRCSRCDNSWNFCVLARRNRHDIETRLLRALETNDPALARRYAFDAAALRNRIGQVEEFPEVAVHKEMLAEKREGATGLEIFLSIEAPISLRLDRLLANELGISRARLQTLGERRWLAVRPAGAKALRKPARNGTAVEIELASEPDREKIILAAGG